MPTAERMVEIFIETFGKLGEFYKKEKWEERLGVWIMCYYKIIEERNKVYKKEVNHAI